MPTTTHDYRRANLRKLIDSFGGPGPLAQKLGYSNSSFLVQMAGPSPIRQVSEGTARRFESVLGLDPGSLDAPVDIPEEDLSTSKAIGVRQANLYRKRKGLDLIPGPAPAPAPNPDLMGSEQLAALVSLVGRVCDETHANLSTGKFADIIVLTLQFKDSHKSLGDEEYVRRLVLLTI